MRYMLVYDNSGHEYVIPVAMKAEFDQWCYIDEDDESSWDVPLYARRVEGGLTFSKPMDCDVVLFPEDNQQ